MWTHDSPEFERRWAQVLVADYVLRALAWHGMLKTKRNGIEECREDHEDTLEEEVSGLRACTSAASTTIRNAMLG